VSVGGEVLVGLAIAVGLLGVLVPVLPGPVLVLGAIAVWAFVEGSTVGWLTLAAAAVFVLASQVVKYAVPGRRLVDAGVPSSTLLTGAALGFVGFFVVPVVGLFLGFVLGVYAAEYRRLGDRAAAWPSTKHALKAAGLSVLIELAGVLLAALTWLGVVLTA